MLLKITNHSKIKNAEEKGMKKIVIVRSIRESTSEIHFFYQDESTRQIDLDEIYNRKYKQLLDGQIERNFDFK